MKKFYFSLEKMLRYQDSLLEEEKNRLAELRAQRNEIERRMQEVENQIEILNHERAEKSAQGISILEMRSYNYSLDAAIRLLKDLGQQRDRAEEMIAKQLERVLLQQREVSGLERLREKQLEEYRIAEQKEQDLLISEMVSSKYIRSRSGAGIS